MDVDASKSYRLTITAMGTVNRATEFWALAMPLLPGNVFYESVGVGV